MPKKKTVKQSKTQKPKFLWSIVFLLLTAALNAYFVYIGSLLGIDVFWPVLAVVASLIAVFLVMREVRVGKLKRGNFLWSIFFAAFTLAVVIVIAYETDFMLWPMIAFGSCLLGVVALVQEKRKG